MIKFSILCYGYWLHPFFTPMNLDNLNVIIAMICARRATINGIIYLFRCYGFTTLKTFAPSSSCGTIWYENLRMVKQYISNMPYNVFFLVTFVVNFDTKRIRHNKPFHKFAHLLLFCFHLVHVK